jgi:hypothetical protein
MAIIETTREPPAPQKDIDKVNDTHNAFPSWQLVAQTI